MELLGQGDRYSHWFYRALNHRHEDECWKLRHLASRLLGRGYVPPEAACAWINLALKTGAS